MGRRAVPALPVSYEPVTRGSRGSKWEVRLPNIGKTGAMGRRAEPALHKDTRTPFKIGDQRSDKKSG